MKNKCNDKDLSQRGADHPQQQEYANTVADYSGLTPSGDNTKLTIACETSVAIGDVVRMDGTTASPGFSFGRSGNLSSNTWLRRPGNVPSNRAGVTIPISNPIITKISCSNRNIETYDIEIYEHDGDEINLTLLTTQTVTAARGAIFSVNISATEGKQLSAKLGSSVGNVRDLGVDIVLKGDN